MNVAYKRMKGLGLFSLEKSRLKVCVITDFPCAGDQLFSLSIGDRTRSNEFNLQA